MFCYSILLQDFEALKNFTIFYDEKLIKYARLQVFKKKIIKVS